LGKSLTLFFVNRQIADKRTNPSQCEKQNSFQELPTVNCFLYAKNGELIKNRYKRVAKTIGLMNARI